MEWEALICEVDTFINEQLKKGLKDDSVASFATDIVWQYVAEDFLPAQANFTVTAVYGDESTVPHEKVFEILKLTDLAVANFTADYINEAFPKGFSIFASVDKLFFAGVAIETSDPENTLARANCPVTVRSTDLAAFTFKFDFEDGHDREPTKDEVEAMICETNKFMQKTLRDDLGDPSIISYATNINWSYNPADQYPSVVEFTSLSLFGDGSHVRGLEVFESMKDADIQFFTEHYVLNSVPYEKNQYFYATEVLFSGAMGQEITSPKIPDGVKCKKYDQSQLAAFSLEVGFASRSGVPSQQEIVGLMCQTGKFFQKKVREELKDDTIVSHPTNIDWSYIPGSPMPAVVNFTAFTTYGDGTMVPAKIVYDIMKVVDVPNFVREYVWNSEPYEENIYYDSKDVLFTGMVNAPLHEGKLSKATCIVAPAVNNGDLPPGSQGASTTDASAHKTVQTDEAMAHLPSH
jgi:hypothetical protein